MYSSFRPISDHYIAYLNKTFNNKRIWIADYRDLPYYFDANEVFLFPKFQLFLLKKIIKNADYVLTISEGLKSFFEKYNDNVVVLRNGISNIIENSVEVKKLEKFTITYTGSLYSGRRDPGVLFLVLNKLIDQNKINIADLNLIYAGRDGALWDLFSKKYHLETAVTNYGMIALQDSIALQTNTHINLLLTWSKEGQKGILTGKFFEYLKAQKNIVVLINGTQDKEFEAIVNELNIGRVAYNEDYKKVESYIISAFNQWKTKGVLENKIDQEKLVTYTWDFQFNEFLNKVNIE